MRQVGGGGYGEEEENGVEDRALVLRQASGGREGRWDGGFGGC